MKTNNIETCNETRRMANGRKPPVASRPPSPIAPAGFTLIELLVVIAIMAALAALTLPVLARVKRLQYLKAAGAEMSGIQLALDNYKAKYSTYPPSNPNSPVLNQLYYELVGTTNINNNATTRQFQALDGSFTVSGGAGGQLSTAFGPGVTALLNCSQYNGSGEDAIYGKDFLLSLKQNQIGTANGVSVLCTSVHGPDLTYEPLGVQDVNPFRYVYPGTNNPSSYDLWIQLVINGKTNLICNWTKQITINSPLP